MKNRERGGHRLRRTHRRRLPVAMATEGKGEGIRAAQGVGYSPWACSRTVGWPGGSGEVVDRGGRAAVGDEHHDAGHQSLRRGRHRISGVLDWRWGGDWVAGKILEWGIGPRPSGGEVLVAGAPVLPGS